MEIYQETIIKLKAKDLLYLDISVPYWENISRFPANQGLIRHGGVTRAERHIPLELKPSYQEHARPFFHRSSRNLLLWGTRIGSYFGFRWVL